MKSFNLSDVSACQGPSYTFLTSVATHLETPSPLHHYVTSHVIKHRTRKARISSTVTSNSNYVGPSVCGTFMGPWPLFQFLYLFTQSVGLLRRGISPSQLRYLHTGQHKHRINAHRHSWLKWDSNPRFWCLSGRIQFMSTVIGNYVGRVAKINEQMKFVVTK
jgi:hypothetical protein